MKNFGKWRYCTISETVRAINSDEIVALPYGYCGEKEKKDRRGRLIASVPEMYETLKNVSDYILECAKLYSPFPHELCMYAGRIKELLARIDGEGKE